MRSLVVSSGGSKGAYAGGIIQKLMEEGIKWTTFIGSSTGSLIIPFIGNNKIQELKEYYTNISNDDIFSINPFKVKNVNGGNFSYSINHINIIKNFIFNKSRTLGDSSNLKSLIKNAFSLDDYNNIIEDKKELIICVTNLTKSCLELKKISECDYDDFCEWIWASTCAPPFMSILEKDGYEYVDGAVTCAIPIRKAILEGASEIDVIILNEKEVNVNTKVKNVLDLIDKVSKLLMDNLRNRDLDIDRLKLSKVNSEPITINFYYTNRKLTNNSLIFNSDVMKNWWNEGYENYHKHSIII